MAEGNGFLSRKFIGSPVSIGTSKDHYEKHLVPGEDVVAEYKGVRDGLALTNKRMLIVDPQGLRGKKICIHSIPYHAISAFSVENSGTFDLDAELKVCGSGFGVLELQFTKGVDMAEVGQVFGKAILAGR